MNRIPSPKVSVIIPNYNHARFLQRRIDSVLGQTFQDFELILLDDCSTDDSRAILAEYADDPSVSRVEFNEQNSGTSFKQWNKGVRLARGEYVWVAESDDYADPRFLERLVAVLEAEPEAAFAYCRSWRVSAEDRVDGFADDFYVENLGTERWSKDFSANGSDECREYFVTCNVVPNASSVLFRRAVYERVGGADETLRMSADWKLWTAMALTGRVAYVSEPLNYYRFHHESVRGRDLSHSGEAEEVFRVVRWIREQVEIDDSALKKLCNYLAILWIPSVLDGRLPLARRWAILRSAMALDSHALRRLAGFTLRTLIRVRFWHPVLNVTRPVRHALGLRQRKERP